MTVSRTHVRLLRLRAGGEGSPRRLELVLTISIDLPRGKTSAILPAAMTYRSTQKKQVDVPFDCPACGVEKDAREVSVGHGLSRTVDPVEVAVAVAAEQATHDAVDVAHEAVDFVRCPSCGHRERGFGSVVLSTRGVVGAGTLSLGGSLILAGSILGAPVVSGWGLIASLASLVVGFSFGTMPPRRVRAWQAAATAEFHERAARKQLAGETCGFCEQKIVTNGEGRRCRRCKAPLHREECLDQHLVAAHPKTNRTGAYR